MPIGRAGGKRSLRTVIHRFGFLFGAFAVCLYMMQLAGGQFQ